MKNSLIRIRRHLRMLNIAIEDINLNQRAVAVQTDINLSLFYVENLRDELRDLADIVQEVNNE